VDFFHAIASITTKQINSAYIDFIAEDGNRLLSSFNSLELVHIRR